MHNCILGCCATALFDMHAYYGRILNIGLHLQIYNLQGLLCYVILRLTKYAPSHALSVSASTCFSCRAPSYLTYSDKASSISQLLGSCYLLHFFKILTCYGCWFEVYLILFVPAGCSQIENQQGAPEEGSKLIYLILRDRYRPLNFSYCNLQAKIE